MTLTHLVIPLLLYVSGIVFSTLFYTFALAGVSNRKKKLGNDKMNAKCAKSGKMVRRAWAENDQGVHTIVQLKKIVHH